jgi:hypothetical protein
MLSLFRSAKQMPKNRMPYIVVMGVASPISVRDVSGSLDIKMEIGIRTRNAELIPWIMTGMLLPQPLK